MRNGIVIDSSHDRNGTVTLYWMGGHYYAYEKKRENENELYFFIASDVPVSEVNLTFCREHFTW